MNPFISPKKQAAISDNSQKRTETLFDAVIAIAMTMIALEINIPKQNIFDLTALHLLFQEITIYFISFIVLASIWGVHTLIYCSYSSLGNPSDIILNIILMFIITLFPILTKLMAAMNNGFLLNLVYLGCYGGMDILVVLLLLLANRRSIRQSMEEFRNITNIIELCKGKMQSQHYEDIRQKLQQVEKYIDDPTTFSQLYQELIASMPKHIQMQRKKQERKQKIQYITVIIFCVIAFIAVLLSVLTMIWNPYWCYLIFVGAIILFIICYMLLHAQERRMLG